MSNNDDRVYKFFISKMHENNIKNLDSHFSFKWLHTTTNDKYKLKKLKFLHQAFNISEHFLNILSNFYSNDLNSYKILFKYYKDYYYLKKKMFTFYKFLKN